jgi:uncharacterized cupin superfamily protein
MHHFELLLSGKLHVKADDGQEIDMGPGDVVDIPQRARFEKTKKLIYTK